MAVGHSDMACLSSSALGQVLVPSLINKENIILKPDIKEDYLDLAELLYGSSVYLMLITISYNLTERQVTGSYLVLGSGSDEQPNKYLLVSVLFIKPEQHGQQK